MLTNIDKWAPPHDERGVAIATRRTQTGQESREALLVAAAELFADKGYRQTTFADIADRARISRGSIPWHFGDKEGLLVAVLQMLSEDVQATFRRHSAPDTLAGLREATGNMIRRPTSKLFLTLLLEAMEPTSPAHEHYAKIQIDLRAQLTALGEALPLPPEIAPADFATTMLGAAMGIHQQWRLTPDAVDVDGALAALHTFITSALVRA
jgi:AcrR family transcriptional regulator